MTISDLTYPLFPIFAFLGFLVSLIPLPWHIQAWNSGTCAFMSWTATICLIEFVNAIVWSGSVNNPAPIWCDISSKLILGASVGIPASTLCISRRLYCITSIQTASVTREDKRRMVIGDLCITIGLPVLIMILHVVVQPHRFDILEDIGCYPSVYNTLPAYFLYFMWPPLLGVASFVYSGLILRSFWMRRVQFTQLLSSSSMNPSRYLRLMMLALIDMMLSIPLSIYSTYISTTGVTLAPWISWEETHFNFKHVRLVPSILWRSDPSFQTSVELTRWLPVFCAFLFFALFGFASEARKQYGNTFWWIAKRFGFSRPSIQMKKGSLPGWIKTPNTTPPTPQSSLPAYSPKSPASKKQHQVNFQSSSFAESNFELDTYTEIDSDIEKSAGLDAPPPSSAPFFGSRNLSEKADQQRLSPQSSRTYLNTKTSAQSLHTTRSQSRIYVFDPYSESPEARTRTPSPAPFSDVIVPPYHRPFTPPTTYPTTQPQPEMLLLDAIRVTVHTQSHSTDDL